MAKEMTKKTITFLGLDITEAVIEDHGSIDAPLTPGDMLGAAYRPETRSIKELKMLLKELKAYPEKYSDICFCVQESSGDKIKDLILDMEFTIKEKENGTYDPNEMY